LHSSTLTIPLHYRSIKLSLIKEVKVLKFTIRCKTKL